MRRLGRTCINHVMINCTRPTPATFSRHLVSLFRSLSNTAALYSFLVGLLWQCEMPRAINCPRSMPCPNLPSCGFYHKAFDCLDWYETKRCKDRICKHHHRPNIHYEDASPLERKPSERDRAPSRSSSSSQSISSSSTSRSHPVSRSETSSSSDAFVAEDWRTCLSSKGEKYYYNSKTRVSVWKRPSGLRYVFLFFLHCSLP